MLPSTAVLAFEQSKLAACNGFRRIAARIKNPIRQTELKVIVASFSYGTLFFINAKRVNHRLELNMRETQFNF